LPQNVALKRPHQAPGAPTTAAEHRLAKKLKAGARAKEQSSKAHGQSNTKSSLANNDSDSETDSRTLGARKPAKNSCVGPPASAKRPTGGGSQARDNDVLAEYLKRKEMKR
jgi:hypothetical protein